MKETPERWLQRQIEEGKARHSAARRIYPNHRSDAEWRSAVIVRAPAQTTTRSNAEIIWPSLGGTGNR